MRRGFTLVEMAIVLIIVSFLIAMGVTSFGKVSQGERYRGTKLYLQKLQDSAITYAMTNGALPCPDIDCDGYEDRCKKEEGCDIDGDGEVDLEEGACLAKYYYTTHTPLRNDRCGDIDFARGQNIPPYLLPYATLGERKEDGFQKPIRYDVNFELAQKGSLQRLCPLVAFLSNKTTINSTPEINSSYYLPIVTDKGDTKDDELITPGTGYSVAALFISQGECPGVSGKNKGGNKEYAAAKVRVEGEGCSGYSDIVGELTIQRLLQGLCSSLSYPQRFFLFVQKVQESSVKLFDGKEWQCYNWKDFGYEEEAGLFFGIDKETRDSVKFFTQSDCNGDPIRLPELVGAYDQGVGIGAEGVEPGEKIVVMIASSIAGHVVDEDGELECTDLSEYPSIVYSIDAQVDEIAFYNSLDDCENERDPITTLAKLWTQGDRNQDRILLLSSDGPKDNGFTTLELILGEDVSYLDDRGCHTIQRSGGKLVRIDLFTNPFILFNKAKCEGEDHYLLNDIIKASMEGKNDGRCLLEKDGELNCNL
ncbi:MAG: hypothetical protein C6I00_02875 [Nitratiruptor sp.]|nr:hypothetical protein [Nitratiruptor sp.]NPA82893.1 type II secretion system protein [Campylobacterota bacterium]